MKIANRIQLFSLFVVIPLVLLFFFLNCSKSQNIAPDLNISNPINTPTSTPDPVSMNVNLPALSLSYPHPNFLSTRSITLNEFVGINVVPALFSTTDWQSQVTKISELGIKWIRVGLFWNLIENDAGVRDFSKLDDLMNIAKSKNLKLLIYVIAPPNSKSAGNGSSRPDQYPPATNQYQYYADFLKSLFIRYKDNASSWGIAAVQIWNEPNLRIFWQTANGYDDPIEVHNLTSVVSSTMTAYDSQIPLILAGLAYWGVMTNSSGQAKNMFVDYFFPTTFALVDAIAAHPYLANPYGDVDNNNNYNFITNGNYFIGAAGKPMWATEWGWGSYLDQPASNEQVSELTQAVYILQRLTLMMAMGFEKNFLFTIQDLSANLVAEPHRSMGLIDINGREKISFKALKNFITEFANESLVPDSNLIFDPPDQKIWSFSFKGSSNKHYYILWSDDVVKTTFHCDSAVRVLNPFDGTTANYESKSGLISISIPKYPIIISY